MEFGGCRVIEENTILKHSNNIRLLKKLGHLQKGSELVVLLYSNYAIYYVDLAWLYSGDT